MHSKEDKAFLPILPAFLISFSFFLSFFSYICCFVIFFVLNLSAYTFLSAFFVLFSAVILVFFLHNFDAPFIIFLFINVIFIAYFDFLIKESQFFFVRIRTCELQQNCYLYCATLFNDFLLVM